jgi:hypothetical protein
LWILAVAIPILALGAGAVVGILYIRSSVGSSLVQNDHGPEVEVVARISVGELHNAYLENALAADQKYTWHGLVLTASYDPQQQTLSKDSDGECSLRLGMRGRLTAVMVYFRPSETKKLVQLKTKDLLAIHGRCEGVEAYEANVGRGHHVVVRNATLEVSSPGSSGPLRSDGNVPSAGPRPTKAPTVNLPAPVADKPQGGPTAKVDPRELFASYGKDVVAAEKKYNGQTLELANVSGKVQKDDAGRYYLLAAEGARFIKRGDQGARITSVEEFQRRSAEAALNTKYLPGVILYLDAKEAGRLAGLSDKMVTVRGKCRGMTLDKTTEPGYFVAVDGVELLGVGESNSPKPPAQPPARNEAIAKKEKEEAAEKAAEAAKAAAYEKAVGALAPLEKQFIGKWRITDGYDETRCFFTVFADHKATMTTKSDVQGKWEYRNEWLRIIWDDGRTDAMRPQPDSKRLRVLARKAGVDWKDKPTSTWYAVKQKITLEELTALALSRPDDGKQDDTPKAGDASVDQFLGRWQLVDEKGVASSFLTVTRSGARRDHAPDSPGKWEVVGKEARFTWEDGFRDILRLEDGKVTFLSLGKESNWDSKPKFQLRAVRIDAAPQDANGKTGSDKTTFTGPRGGQFHYSQDGKKVYEKKK